MELVFISKPLQPVSATESNLGWGTHPDRPARWSGPKSAIFQSDPLSQTPALCWKSFPGLRPSFSLIDSSRHQQVKVRQKPQSLRSNVAAAHGGVARRPTHRLQPYGLSFFFFFFFFGEANFYAVRKTHRLLQKQALRSRCAAVWLAYASTWCNHQEQRPANKFPLLLQLTLSLGKEMPLK